MRKRQKSWFLVFRREMGNLFTKLGILMLNLCIFLSRKKQKKVEKPKNLFQLPQARLDQFDERSFEGIHALTVKGRGSRFQLTLELSVSVPPNWLSGLRIHAIPKSKPSARILYKVAKVSDTDNGCVLDVVPYNWYWRYRAWRNARCEGSVRAICFISKSFHNEKYFCSSGENLEWTQGEFIRFLAN